jgi:uncharacterized protein YbjT (DUF2867 family)
MVGTARQAGGESPRPWRLLEVSLVILGGNSLLVSYLLPRLQRNELGALVVARRPVAVPDGFGFLERDILDSQGWAPPPGAVVISALPLPVLVRALGGLSGVHAIIAIGSTSRFSKHESADPAERQIARALEDAETALIAWARDHDVRCTILRPTLVYDGIGDRNVARMAGLIRRFRMLLLARPATGLRQPIHADDVAKAIIGAIGNPAAQDRTFNIAGGEVLTYRAMAERVFAAQGATPRLLMLPVGWLRASFRLAHRCGLFKGQGFGSAVFERMNRDLVYDVAEGLEILDYRPRRFEPAPGLQAASDVAG